MTKLIAVRVAIASIDSDNGYLSFLYLSLSSFCVTEALLILAHRGAGRSIPIQRLRNLCFSWHIFYFLKDDIEGRQFHWEKL
jgi:hypothetical protein